MEETELNLKLLKYETTPMELLTIYYYLTRIYQSLEEYV